MKVMLLFLFLACGVARAVPPTEFDNQYGHFIITPFATAPFPHPSRANGHKYHKDFYSAATNYSDSTVALFIPAGFRATDRIDFLVHFHGWRHTVATTLLEYQLPEQFSASGKNAILIVPQGPYNSPDSFGGKLEDTNGFARFMAEAMADLKTAGVVSNDAVPGDIILSAHSGGYETMFSILDHGGMSDQVREVWMFDCLYAGSDQFLAWADHEIGQKGEGRLLDIYTDHGGTLENSLAMVATLRQKDRAVISTNDLAVTPAMLATNHFVFLHSDLPHDDVMARRKTFQEFLETSFLPAIKVP
jgi:hypothetical protein